MAVSAQALIRQAQASGVALRLVGGKVKASGPREAVARLLVPLREHRAALADALQTVPVGPLPCSPADATPEPADWHALDAEYLAHHFSCSTCIAAGRGNRYGLRCVAGAALWRAYSRFLCPSIRDRYAEGQITTLENFPQYIPLAERHSIFQSTDF